MDRLNNRRSRNIVRIILPSTFWLCYVVSGSHLLGIDHHLYTHMVTSWWMNLGYWLGNPEFGNFVQTFFFLFYFFGSAHTHTHTHRGERDDGWWFGFGTVFLFFFFSPLTPHHPFRFFWALLGTFWSHTKSKRKNKFDSFFLFFFWFGLVWERLGIIIHASKP